MKKTLITLIAIVSITITSIAQNVNIPDANFKAKLLINTSINTDADKLEISVAEAIAFKGFISVASSNIASLVGIESFINITKLYCYTNQLTSLDLTKNTALTYIECYSNQLTSLNVTKNTALTGLYCSSNQLTSLDVTYNTALTTFYCGFNTLTSLDVSKNTALTLLDCSNNQLTSLDLTKITALNTLGSNHNPNLTCIQVLNTQIKTLWWYKDNTVTYNENCNYVTSIKEEILTQPKTISNIYNLQGQAVNNTYQGLVIIRYTDGTSEKVVQ